MLQRQVFRSGISLLDQILQPKGSSHLDESLHLGNRDHLGKESGSAPSSSTSEAVEDEC